MAGPEAPETLEVTGNTSVGFRHSNWRRIRINRARRSRRGRSSDLPADRCPSGILRPVVNVGQGVGFNGKGGNTRT